MAGGTAGAPTSGATGQATAQGMPSQASQYSNYGAQPNGAFYGGPNSGAPASGGFPSPAYGQQMNQPQFGGGYGQGYGSPFGGMGGGYGYQETPQYGYGGMGRQFMGGGMYGPRGGFGGGFDPRMVMQQMYGQQAAAQQAAAQPTATEAQPTAQAQPQGPAFGGFRGPRRGFGGYGGGFDPRMMRGGFGGYDY